MQQHAVTMQQQATAKRSRRKRNRKNLSYEPINQDYAFLTVNSLKFFFFQEDICFNDDINKNNAEFIS